jgi:hypothetical protein
MAGYVGTLQVYVSAGDDSKDSVPVWYRKSHAGSQWFEAGIDLPPSVFPIHKVSVLAVEGFSLAVMQVW